MWDVCERQKYEALELYFLISCLMQKCWTFSLTLELHIGGSVFSLFALFHFFCTFFVLCFPAWSVACCKTCWTWTCSQLDLGLHIGGSVFSWFATQWIIRAPINHIRPCTWMQLIQMEISAALFQSRTETYFQTRKITWKIKNNPSRPLSTFTRN